MYYAEIIDNKVTFKTSTPVDGYEVIPDYVMPGWVKNIDGSFSIPAYTPEQAMSRLRFQRDQLLAQTDWRMVTDYPRTNQTEWRTYRQSLRDITTQTPSLDVDGNLTGITWPTPPND